ncbi:hypothetical protein [Actinosynnema sp. NPDC023587]|uniref:hypothetical protein n=1 Tax=Actinosynnema sp. NPDC023587 TaxID=3154695 RepID=UPI0033EFB7BF
MDWRNPAQFTGQRVVIVGGSNFGAQITADLAGHIDLVWIIRRPPCYLPDEIDGKAPVRHRHHNPSATLIGVGPMTKVAVARICEVLGVTARR